jgi:hypothetical protein
MLVSVREIPQLMLVSRRARFPESPAFSPPQRGEGGRRPDEGSPLWQKTAWSQRRRVFSRRGHQCRGAPPSRRLSTRRLAAVSAPPHGSPTGVPTSLPGAPNGIRPPFPTFPQ